MGWGSFEMEHGPQTQPRVLHSCQLLKGPGLVLLVLASTIAEPAAAGKLFGALSLPDWEISSLTLLLANTSGCPRASQTSFSCSDVQKLFRETRDYLLFKTIPSVL